MKALVFDVNIEEIIHLIQEARDNKEAYLGEHSPIALQEIPDARVQFPDWLVIKTRLCGICGSDYKQVFIDFENIDSPLAGVATFPQVMGHEVVGTVAAVGPAGDGRGAIGQRVVLNPWLSCAPRGIAPVCEACARGTVLAVRQLPPRPPGARHPHRHLPRSLRRLRALPAGAREHGHSDSRRHQRRAGGARRSLLGQPALGAAQPAAAAATSSSSTAAARSACARSRSSTSCST